MDFDKVHDKCFAALPRIARGDIPPKFAKHAQAHLAECDECREELARLREDEEAEVLDLKAQPSTLTALPTGSIPVSAGVPSPPTPLVDKVEPSRWLRWGPVLLGVLVLETALLGWILFQSGQPASAFIRCVVSGG